VIVKGSRSRNELFKNQRGVPNALDDWLPVWSNRLSQDFDNSQFLSVFRAETINRVGDRDDLKIRNTTARVLIKSKPAPADRSRSTSATENPRLPASSSACVASSEENLTFAVQDLLGFVKDRGVANYKDHGRRLNVSRVIRSSGI